MNHNKTKGLAAAAQLGVFVLTSCTRAPGHDSSELTAAGTSVGSSDGLVLDGLSKGVRDFAGVRMAAIAKTNISITTRNLHKRF